MCEERNAWLDFHMELPSATHPFNLEQAVCSHGLFMMPPNKWDPLSKTLTRPLHSSSSSSLLVSISQRHQSLAVRVHNTHFLSSQQQCHVTVLTVSSDYCVRFGSDILILYGAVSGSGFQNAAVVGIRREGREGLHKHAR